MSRYVVRACEGYLTERGGKGGDSAPGVSYVVLDTFVNYAPMAECRSEDYPAKFGRAGMRKLAEQAARSLADRLNGDAEPLPPVTIKRRPIAKPQAHWSFRPTCPRCCVICPVGARDCPECGAFLYLTDDELAEL